MASGFGLEPTANARFHFRPCPLPRLRCTPACVRCCFALIPNGRTTSRSRSPAWLSGSFCRGCAAPLVFGLTRASPRRCSGDRSRIRSDWRRGWTKTGDSRRFGTRWASPSSRWGRLPPVRRWATRSRACFACLLTGRLSTGWASTTPERSVWPEASASPEAVLDASSWPSTSPRRTIRPSSARPPATIFVRPSGLSWAWRISSW